MTSVDVLLTEPGRGTRPAGWIDFYVLPLLGENQFVCTPPAIVSFAEARAISVDLSQDVHRGSVGRYTWRKSPWWRSGLFRGLRRLWPRRPCLLLLPGF